MTKIKVHKILDIYDTHVLFYQLKYKYFKLSMVFSFNVMEILQ